MQILHENEYSCVQCKKKGRNNLTLDHKVSIAKGGLNVAANIQPLCIKCHASKDNARSNFFRKVQRYLKKLKYRHFDKH
jgi:5-methylcytosine-specific restriction endonuclease McrA